MVLKVFGVYDLKACAYMQPFFSGNSGSAMRAFGDAANDGKSPISAHPGDYQLFELGTFDDNSGSIVGSVPMKLLCVASDFCQVPDARKALERVNVTDLEAIANGKD